MARLRSLLAVRPQGPTSLSISSVVVVPGTDFSQSNDCGSLLAPNTNCTITVTFSAIAMGIRTASLTVTDNASNGPQTANLRGTGGSPGVDDGLPAKD